MAVVLIYQSENVVIDDKNEGVGAQKIDLNLRTSHYR